MQKKIIALALASALTAPALAMADVTVYGKADLAFGSTSNGTVRNTQVSSQVTKLGFKGSEDLGDGLNAIWQIEQQIDIDNAGGANSTKNTLASRNSFLGLKGESWGTVLMGRHDSPYKIATRSLDVFADQFADNRHLMGGVGANNGSTMDARPGNVVAYISPKIGGAFTVAAAYAANTEVATTAVQNKGNVWALAGMYDQGPFYGAVAYQVVNFSNVATTAAPAGATGLPANAQFYNATAGSSVKGWKIGGGYAVMESLKLNAVYEKISSSVGGIDTLGRTNWNVAGVYSFGNDDIKLSYTKAGNVTGTANTGAKMIGVGYDHNLSKRTSLYAQYNRIANDTLAAYGFNSAATTAVVTGVAGQKTSGFMVGMKHTF